MVAKVLIIRVDQVVTSRDKNEIVKNVPQGSIVDAMLAIALGPQVKSPAGSDLQ